jgi:hypothetical protein
MTFGLEFAGRFCAGRAPTNGSAAGSSGAGTAGGGAYSLFGAVRSARPRILSLSSPSAAHSTSSV